MQTVKIHTSQNIEIDYEVAGLGERVLARIVDMGVFMGIGYICYFIIIFFFLTTIQNFKGDSIPAVLIVIAIIYSLAAVFYDLVAEVFFNGQTIGKYAVKIKVVSINGSRPSFGQFLLRWVFRLVDFGITFGIGALISVAVSEKKQRIGDIVAGTTVIKTTPKAQLGDLVFAYQDDEYDPTFNNVADLKDSDITLIHEVISNFKSTGNSQIVYDMAVRVKEYIHADIPQGMNEYDFLLTVIKDYSHVVARMGV
ncbi:RDD family protein [Mucilaginibacter rubeus]|uniref:RDD family protein n=2 Tax=Mucilaginibacter TaxID=423349 RepID=A0AAE6ML71_9SPHI|nr:MULTISPECIES: RDD family protein [Mucilaginibacter]QEM07475.1 RDD family protein [Mucilaginibacter rubeus]QEM19928.1 RDD family protein [Mucilaginibacter gossypii]QTE43364.1 RDD family protein [Mucilaginibacter rubeus]QTE49964.1 RDD family protein [Mucilaginibacter rubeus]QTE55055.1 RDD family protein [Mucilaginibacter rubeus]